MGYLGEKGWCQKEVKGIELDRETQERKSKTLWDSG